MSFSAPPIFAAWRQTWRAGYTLERLRGDLVAGLTVGIIAIPLAMALAIAVGVPPQHGLYTVLVAAPLLALTGGSRFSGSGPTAACVVILRPITQQYGLGGLRRCTMLAGMILIALGLMRAGRLIQYIPYPVVLGFTAGIGVVIATLQLKDLLGLTTVGNAEHYIEQLGALITALPSARLGDGLIGLTCRVFRDIWSPCWWVRCWGWRWKAAAGKSRHWANVSATWSTASVTPASRHFCRVSTGLGISRTIRAAPWNCPTI